MFRIPSTSFMLLMALLIVLSTRVNGFVVVTPSTTSMAFRANNQKVPSTTITELNMMSSSPSFLLSADPVDPTSVINDSLGGLVDSPLILAVPIVAGLLVTAVIVWINFAIAQPAVNDDNYEYDESAFDYDE